MSGADVHSLLVRVALYALLVIVVTLLAGLLPALGRPAGRRRELGMALAAGVVLGAAFFHMLPEAFEAIGWRVVPGVLAGVVTLLLIERFVLSRFPALRRVEDGGEATVGLATFVGLSLHTLVDGIALGSALDAGELGAVVVVAILLHKVPLSFSLSSILRQEGRSTARVLAMVTAFGAMVPAGAAAYLLLSATVDTDRALAVTPHALAFSAGTFLHVAFDDLLPALHRRRARPARMVTAFVLGLAVTWAVGLLGHAH